MIEIEIIAVINHNAIYFKRTLTIDLLDQRKYQYQFDVDEYDCLLVVSQN